MELSYGLGCPECPYWVELSGEDPDASLSELSNHIFGKHSGYDRKRSNEMLARSVELTESQAALR